MATTYRCISADNTGLSFQHDAGDGNPPRKKCRYCGGSFVTFEGVYGAFEWTADGRYPLDKAIQTFPTRAKADAWIEANGGEFVSRWIPTEAKTASALDTELDAIFTKMVVALPQAPDDELLAIWREATAEQRKVKGPLQDALSRFRGKVMAEMTKRRIDHLAAKTAADDLNYWSGGGGSILSAMWHAFLNWIIGHNGYGDYADEYAFASLKPRTAAVTDLSDEELVEAYFVTIEDARADLDRWGDAGRGNRQRIFDIEAEFKRRGVPKPPWPARAAHLAASIVHNPCPNCGSEVRFITPATDDERMLATYDDIAPWTCDGCGMHGTADDLDAAAREASLRHSRGGPFGLMTEAIFRAASADDPYGTCIHCGHLGNEHTGSGCDGCKAAGMVECRGFEDSRRYASHAPCTQPHAGPCDDGGVWVKAARVVMDEMDRYLGPGALRSFALNEQKAPPEVDTLRDEQCPVCGEMDGYSGDECAVCGYKKPPSFGMDPDTERAKAEDLRKDQEDGQDAQGGGLEQFRVDGPTDSPEAAGEGLERFRVATKDDYCPDCNSDREHPRFRIGRGRCQHPFHKVVDLPKAASWPGAPAPTAEDLAFGDWWSKNAHITDEDAAWDAFQASTV